MGLRNRVLLRPHGLVPIRLPVSRGFATVRRTIAFAPHQSRCGIGPFPILPRSVSPCHPRDPFARELDTVCTVGETVVLDGEALVMVPRRMRP